MWPVDIDTHIHTYICIYIYTLIANSDDLHISVAQKAHTCSKPTKNTLSVVCLELSQTLAR